MKDGTYLIRSFTPYQEEPFCGHGLLAAALLLRCNHPGEEMSLRTIDGIMVKARSVASDSSESAITMYGEPYQMKLEMPAVPVTESFDGDVNVRTKIAKSLGVTSSQILGLWRNALMDVVIELDPGVDFSAAGMDLDAVELMHASPAGTRSQVITSRGDRHGVDFLERVFAYGSEGKTLPWRVTWQLTLFHPRSSNRFDILCSDSLLDFQAEQVVDEGQASFRADWSSRDRNHGK